MTAVKPLRRGLAVLATLALVLSVMALPAVAAPQKGTASVAALDSFASDAVYAGTTNQAFEVTVTNAADLTLLASPVNWIEVDPTSDFAIAAAEGPGDWVGEIRDSGRVVFSGDTLGPGDSVTFTVTTNVGRPAGDIDLPWTVTASNDGGDTGSSYNPASDGALSPMIRVLQVVGNAFTGPTLILDGDATEGQTVDGEAIIANLGSGTVSVTPTLSGQNFSPSGDLATFDLGAGTQQVVPWTVTLGDGDTTTVTADATGQTAGWGPSDAPVAKSTNPLTVLDAADLDYIEGSLSPTIVGTAEAVTFDVTADFQNLGGVSVDPIDLTNTTLSVTLAGVTYTASASGPSSIAPDQSATFTFSGLSIPAGIEGTANPVVEITGTDQNGMAVSQVFTLPDTISFDPNAPTLTLAVDLPTTEVAGEEDAATTGVPFGIEGTVEDNGSGCGKCSVSAILVEYDFAGTELNRTTIPLSNDGNGNLSASVEHTFNASTVEAAVLGSAVDQAGLTSDASTAKFPVDLIKPTQGSAVTGGPNGQDYRRIDISLSERVAFPQLLTTSDFAVEGNVVTEVRLEDSRGINNNSADAQGNTYPIGDTIVLTVGQDLGEDETPVVIFEGKSINQRPYDRVGLELGDFRVEAADGIIPDLPSVDSLGGLGEYDDPADSSGPRFYTNQSAPVMVVSNVSGGHKVNVYRDDNTNGVVDPDDRLVGTAEALQSGSLEIQLDDLGNLEQSLTLLTRATDGSQNHGLVAADDVTIDLTAPTFASVTTDEGARTVTVGFSETLRNGRNAIGDWVVEKLRFGRYVALERESVSGEHGVRTIHIAESEDQWDGTVNRLTYDFTGSEGQRYIDRAGNLLGDFVHEQ